MKKILLFAFAAFMAVTVNAQTLRFVDQEGVEYENGAVIEAYEVEPELMNLVWHLNLKNTSDQAQDFIIYHEVEELSGFMQFCGNAEVTTGLCYGATSVGADEYGPYTLAAGATEYCFHAAIMMMTETTAARVTYTAYPESNPEDASYVTVIYTYEAYQNGINAVEKAFVNNKVNMFQRNGSLVCNYEFDNAAKRSVVVSNIVGARVATVVLDGTQGEVVLNRLPKGVYVYTLVENGRAVKSHKVVVR